ncbi:MAG: glutamate racemase [Lentisphaeria bacterium]|nr:glutamate racemase [Lentisphaeria bacterium]
MVLNCNNNQVTDPERAIGVFDSGLGGLSVVRELLALGAGRHIHYLADQCHAPYGVQSMETILAWSKAISEWFIRGKIKVIVLACNSASAAALYSLREQFPAVHFVGMEPAVKPAVAASKTGRVAVLATAATLAGGPYKKVLRDHANGCQVIPRACPKWVDLVENPPESPEEVLTEVKSVVAPLLADGVDQLILGCTHFSFLKNVIQSVCQGNATVIDPAVAVARQAERIADTAGVHRGGRSDCRLFTTGDAARFEGHSQSLLGQSFPVKTARWDG